MERYFIFDKLNTWYDLRFIVTAKSIPYAEPKTKYISIDGMSGTLDLSESLTGETTYNDRTLTASFWSDVGNRTDREALLQKISASLHGKKVKIIEPDDPDHYFYGRVKIKSKRNNMSYADFTVEAVCDPWRYALEETTRRVDVNGSTTDVVINNNGVKTLCPDIYVNGIVEINCKGVRTTLTSGTHKIPDIKLYQGVNLIGVSGNGSVTFLYREADL